MQSAKNKLTDSAAIGLAALLWVGAGRAQDLTDQSWESLSSLRQGQKIEVVHQDGARYRGRFRAVSDESITMRHQGKARSISRGEVAQVAIKDKSKRWRRAAIFGAVGAGVGLGLAAALLAATDGSDAAGQIVYSSALIGAGAGAGAGAAAPGYRTIYAERAQTGAQ